MAAACDRQPVTRELLQARAFAGKRTAACPSCYAEFLAGASFCPECGVRVPETALPPAAPAAAEA